MKKGISIALDGPAGSGKSTIARAVASKFGYTYIDTGAMYRAVALKALWNKISVNDGAMLTDLAEQTSIQLRYIETGAAMQLRVIIDGRDVTEEIRSMEVTAIVSAVAAVPGVRAAMVRIQREMAREGGVVMDGRDIGTVVLPDAELKIFLTASVQERTKRRWLELKAKGVEVSLEELEKQIRKRDDFDSKREIDPLRKAEDALILDTTDLNIDEVTAKVVQLAVAKGAVLKE